MSDKWVDALPQITLSFLSGSLMIESYLPGMKPGSSVDCWQYNEILKKRIRETNKEILRAKTSDEAATAEARIKVFRDEQQKILTIVRKTAIRWLLKTEYVCVAYLEGQRVIVPSRAWSGIVDWDDETILFAKQRYSHLRVIARGKLKKAQWEKVKRMAKDEPAKVIISSGAPGRPSSMNLVRHEFKRRKAGKRLKESLAAEAVYLEAWLKSVHPKAPLLKAKTIANNLRGEYRIHVNVNPKANSGSKRPKK